MVVVSVGTVAVGVGLVAGVVVVIALPQPDLPLKITTIGFSGTSIEL